MWFLIKRRSSHKYLDNDKCVQKLGGFLLKCTKYRHTSTACTCGCVTVYWVVTPIIHVYVINVGYTSTYSHVHTHQIYTVQRLLTYFANLQTR